jgi:hypothetical protein
MKSFPERLSDQLGSIEVKVLAGLTAGVLAVGAVCFSGCSFNTETITVPENAQQLGCKSPFLGNQTCSFRFSPENRDDAHLVDCGGSNFDAGKEHESDGSIIVSCATNFMYDQQVIVK